MRTAQPSRGMACWGKMHVAIWTSAIFDPSECMGRPENLTRGKS